MASLWRGVRGIFESDRYLACEPTGPRGGRLVPDVARRLLQLIALFWLTQHTSGILHNHPFEFYSTLHRDI